MLDDWSPLQSKSMQWGYQVHRNAESSISMRVARLHLFTNFLYPNSCIYLNCSLCFNSLHWVFWWGMSSIVLNTWKHKTLKWTSKLHVIQNFTLQDVLRKFFKGLPKGIPSRNLLILFTYMQRRYSWPTNTHNKPLMKNYIKVIYMCDICGHPEKAGIWKKRVIYIPLHACLKAI